MRDCARMACESQPTRRWLVQTLVLVVVTAMTACSSNSLYKVKPFVKLPPMPESARTADVGQIAFRAAPLLTDEESQELFEANLPLAGLFPVRVEIAHNSGDPIDFKKVRFRLRDAAGVEWKAITAKKAIGRILKANAVYAYNPNSRKTFEKEFGAYELNLKTPLTHEERRRGGFLIFQSPKQQPVESPHGMVLTIEGLPRPVTLTLN
jgi:hypothetical protein